MEAILKTWPAFMPRWKVLKVFTNVGEWETFYFTLGRGRPQRAIDRLYFTHRGLIVGHFPIAEVVQNVGQLPKLRALSGEISEWQIKGDNWVAVCPPKFERLKEKLYHEGFRGWRYFDLESYRGTIGAKVRI